MYKIIFTVLLSLILFQLPAQKLIAVSIHENGLYLNDVVDGKKKLIFSISETQGLCICNDISQVQDTLIFYTCKKSQLNIGSKSERTKHFASINEQRIIKSTKDTPAYTKSSTCSSSKGIPINSFFRLLKNSNRTFSAHSNIYETRGDTTRLFLRNNNKFGYRNISISNKKDKLICVDLSYPELNIFQASKAHDVYIMEIDYFTKESTPLFMVPKAVVYDLAYSKDDCFVFYFSISQNSRYSGTFVYNIETKEHKRIKIYGKLIKWIL